MIELIEPREYTCIFEKKPLGFKVLGDTRWHNAVVTSLLDNTCGVRIGSVILKINNHYVHGMPHEHIAQIAKKSHLPLSITFGNPDYVINKIFVLFLVKRI